MVSLGNVLCLMWWRSFVQALQCSSSPSSEAVSTERHRAIVRDANECGKEPAGKVRRDQERTIRTSCPFILAGSADAVLQHRRRLRSSSGLPLRCVTLSNVEWMARKRWDYTVLPYLLLSCQGGQNGPLAHGPAMACSVETGGLRQIRDESCFRTHHASAGGWIDLAVAMARGASATSKRPGQNQHPNPAIGCGFCAHAAIQPAGPAIRLLVLNLRNQSFACFSWLSLGSGFVMAACQVTRHLGAALQVLEHLCGNGDVCVQLKADSGKNLRSTVDFPCGLPGSLGEGES